MNNGSPKLAFLWTFPISTTVIYGYHRSLKQSKVQTYSLFLISNSLGDWQKTEYYQARDKKAKNDAFVLLPIVIADKSKNDVPNLPGLAQLHWMEFDRTDGSGTITQNYLSDRRERIGVPQRPLANY